MICYWRSFMENKIILSADSTCDLSEELKEKYDVNFYPFHVILGEEQYRDGVDITPDEIYSIYKEKKILPKTAATGVGEYIAYFKKWTDQGYKVIHINIGSGLSSSYQSCCLAAKELSGKIYPIDSCSLSSGTGLLVIEAAKRIKAGIKAEKIQEEVSKLTEKVQASFVVDTLEFLHAGGRCSSVAALGANLLRLKPSIEVDHRDGTMGVGKKYRGDLDKVLLQYVNDKLAPGVNVREGQAFITHSGISEERICLVKKELEKLHHFENIYVTRASCTVSAHCGPNTLGVIFMIK